MRGSLETRYLYMRGTSRNEYLYMRGSLETRYLYIRGTSLELSPLNTVFEAAFAGTSEDVTFIEGFFQAGMSL